MKKLKYKIQSGNYSVTITELEYRSIQKNSVQQVIIIYDDDLSEVNALIEIVIDDYLLIHYYLESFNIGLTDLTIYAIPKTQTVLIGGKRKSCSIDMVTGRVEHEFEHCLFWDFSLLENCYVLETGELDCLLRDGRGRIVAQTAVDPPWESFYEADGIRFNSIVHGETFLKYPRR